MTQGKNICFQCMFALLPIFLIFAVALAPTSIYFLCLPTTVEKVKDHVVNYTNCKNSINEDETCLQYYAKHPKLRNCTCLINFNITDYLKGNVTVSYELDSFDTSKLNLTSRDHKQLQGDLSSAPSVNCGEYRYVVTDGKQIPIVPCGEVADYMFSDNFRFRNLDLNKYIVIQSGAISAEDKLNFRNPANFTEFEKYAKPKGWKEPIQNLRPTQPDNNGLVNEMFISWMKTEWKRKPIGMVKPDDEFAHGLPNGSYKLRVSYNYPTERYSGSRVVILSVPVQEENITTLVIGISGLVVALLLFGLAGIFYGCSRKALRKESEKTDATAKNELEAMVSSNVD